MTTHILRSDCAQGQLLTMKEASQVGNVSISTLRLWDSEGVLETRRTVGGHRRIVKGSLLSCLGVPDSGIGKIICIYLRVSSRKQESAGSLERQRERMLEWVKERFGLGENEILIIRDVASAFGSRTGLQKVVDGIIAGEISHVIAEHQDRLSRVGSELRLLEHLANQNGCELIYAKQTISDESDQSFMVRELIDFVTVICNRISSRKAAALARADVSDDVIERTQELLEEGYGLTSVIPKLQEEGFCSTIRGEPAPITYGVLRKRLIEQDQWNPIRTPQLPKVDPVVIERFISETCTVGKQEKEWSDELFLAYVRWAKAQEIDPLPRRAFVENVKRMGFVNYRSTKSRRRWIGLRLNSAD